MVAPLMHPHIGEVIGKSRGNVVQYLGIQYATLDHPFATPVVKDQYETQIDATSFGPTVVTPPVGCDIEFGLIQKCLDKPLIPPPSTLEGLNLNITIPSQARSLPVLVFIHGGGFVFGGNWAPHYDLANIVEFATLQGKPIVGVSINYRLGAPGFLDAESLRAAGIPPNRGLLDQKAALEWVSQNISGFGGDPGRVTVVGQSAGGGSVAHLFDLMQDTIPLFHRAVVLSGNKLSTTVLPASVAQESYKSVMAALGIDAALSAEEAVSRLIASSLGDLLGKIQLNIPLGPVVDDHVIPSFATLQMDVVNNKHKIPLMIGSTSYDGSISEILSVFADRNDDRLVEEFSSIFLQAIDQTNQRLAAQLLDNYGLLPSGPPGSCNLSVGKVNILQLATDITYFATAHAYAEVWPSSSWLYYFQEPNAWEGPNKGRATHVLDIAYLFLNYREQMAEKEVNVAEAFATDVIRFVHGESSWASFQDKGSMRIYGPSGSTTVETVSYGDVGPSLEVRALWDEIGLDQLSKAWNAYFLRQKPTDMSN